jgi:hypothetical protein
MDENFANKGIVLKSTTGDGTVTSESLNYCSKWTNV